MNMATFQGHIKDKTKLMKSSIFFPSSSEKVATSKGYISFFIYYFIMVNQAFYIHFTIIEQAKQH